LPEFTQATDKKEQNLELSEKQDLEIIKQIRAGENAVLRELKMGRDRAQRHDRLFKANALKANTTKLGEPLLNQ
jgi:hypothetical protein